MKKSIKNNFKRLLSWNIIIALVITALPLKINRVKADEVDLYPYTIFASSDCFGAVTMKADNICANGNISTNGTIVTEGNANFNGKNIENANEKMKLFVSQIEETYFSGDDVEKYEELIREETNINITSPYEIEDSVRLKGNITILNKIKACGDINILGEVINTNESIICSETGNINISVTNASINGLLYSPMGNIEITGENINLNNVVIIANKVSINGKYINMNYSEKIAKFVGGNSEERIDFFWASGNYDVDNNSIDIEWYSSIEDECEYQILVSDDNVNYTTVADVNNETKYNYVINDEFDERYFKVSLMTKYGKKVETIPFFVTKEENIYKIQWIDTDEDGIEDFFEEMYETNVDLKDTDKDGLTDYQEIYITNTDATKYDSVMTGISDAEADSDIDGISNKREIELGTDSLKADTDKDGLKDGEEVNKYRTNPLEKDTDEDGLYDEEEVILGTDALVSDTDKNGILDADEYFQQEVSKKCFAKELFDDNIAIPTKLNVLAKGNVNRRINISEYDGYLKGDERDYIGKVLEIRNADIKSGSISFALNSDYEIEKYETVFGISNGLLICYNDGKKTTPLKTEYDEKTRMLSADITASGIYYVFDVMDCLDSLGFDLPTEDCSYVTKVDNSLLRRTAKKASNIANTKVKAQADIVFVLDTTGSMGSYVNKVKKNIADFVDEIKDADISPSFALIDYRDVTCDTNHPTQVIKNGSSNWYKKTAKLKQKLAKLNINGGGDIPESAIDGLEKARRLDWRKSAQKFVVLVTDADYKKDNTYNIEKMKDEVNLLKKDGINVSVVSKKKYQSDYKSLYNGTGGIFADIEGTFKSELLKIADEIDRETNNGYWICLKGLSVKRVKLDVKPTKNSTADTDSDTIPDFKELKTIEPEEILDYNEYLSILSEGNVSYRFAYPKAFAYGYYSDPTKKDTDGDDFTDIHDLNPCFKPKHYEMYKKISNYEKDLTGNRFKKEKSDSSKIYGAGKEKYNAKEIIKVIAKKEYAKEIAKSGVGSIIGINAGIALGWFLSNTGKDREFSEIAMYSYKETNYGKKQYDAKYEDVIEYAESVLKDGESLVITSKNVFDSYEEPEKVNLRTPNDMNWYATLGISKGACVAEIKRTGKEYKVKFRYAIFDFYNWNLDDDNEFVKGLQNKDLAAMHHLGIAKDYYQYGELSGKSIWKRK